MIQIYTRINIKNRVNQNRVDDRSSPACTTNQIKYKTNNQISNRIKISQRPKLPRKIIQIEIRKMSRIRSHQKENGSSSLSRSEIHQRISRMMNRTSNSNSR